MHLNKANPREYLRQAIDTEIDLLESSIRESVLALRQRREARNALAPISSLPTDVIEDIFSLLRVPGASPPCIPGEKPERLDSLAWLRVAHVCHQWREIAFNHLLFWSHVDFTTVSSAGAAEMLARAKKAPLHLEARIPDHWDNARFSAFERELLPRLSHTRYLSISTKAVYLRRTIHGLASPAPTLEYLSLSQPSVLWARVIVPDTLFDNTTPSLSSLEIRNCDISWKSPLLKGLRNLEIRAAFENVRPCLTDWLDALGEMPRLKKLVLHSASPNAFPFPFDIERTITLPFLTHLDVSTSADDCALALAHLVLPALACLCLTAEVYHRNGEDLKKILPYVARHSHGPQDPRPLQSMLICGKTGSANILAWPVPVPDIDIQSRSPVSWPAATLSARVTLSITAVGMFGPQIQHQILDVAMAALPLDSLVTLTAQRFTEFDDQLWLRHAPRWPLLQRVRLAPLATHGFIEMLLQDNGGRECPLLPSLTTLDLTGVALSARTTDSLCDALTKRGEQGVPLETLDLRTCHTTSHAVRLLGEIVVDVLAPAEIQDVATWGLFVPHDSEADYYSDGDDDDYDDQYISGYGDSN